MQLSLTDNQQSLTHEVTAEHMLHSMVAPNLLTHVHSSSFSQRVGWEHCTRVNNTASDISTKWRATCDSNDCTINLSHNLYMQ